MKLRYVTSMSQRQYDQYGKVMLETFKKYWPEGELLVYSEDTLPQHLDISYRSLQETPGLDEFMEVTHRLPIFSGVVNGVRNYRWDIHHFSRKAFAQMDAACDFSGYLYWIDADTVTEDYIPQAALEKWLEGSFCCVMKRKTWHLCSSFVGWDCAHTLSGQWWPAYFDIYSSGKVFLLPEWHDAYVLERALEQMPFVNDIAKDITGDGPYNVFDDVFKGYARHLKGNLKNDVSPADVSGGEGGQASPV